MDKAKRELAERLLRDARELGEESVIAQLEALLVPARFKLSLTIDRTTVSYVPAQSETDPNKAYVVTVVAGDVPVACTCPSFDYHLDEAECKHMRYTGFWTWKPGRPPVSS